MKVFNIYRIAIMCPNNNIIKCRSSTTTSAMEETVCSSQPSPVSVVQNGIILEDEDRMNSKKESSSTGQQWKDVNNSSSSQLPAFIESLSPSQQFVTIAGSMFLFFGVHNLLQEAIMKVPGFEGVMLTYMEVLG